MSLDMPNIFETSGLKGKTVRKREQVGPDGTVMGGKYWFGARAVFQDKETGVYSERVTITAERDTAAARRASQSEFRLYAKWTKSRRVIGRMRSFPLFETGRRWSSDRHTNMDGLEVFRHAVRSDLEPEDYLDRVFDTGTVEVDDWQDQTAAPLSQELARQVFPGEPAPDEQWWSVRTFHDHGAVGEYVERITLWSARSSAEAIGRAEKWVRDEGDSLGVYMNNAQCHPMSTYSPPGRDEGVFSWERQSKLAGAKYLDWYFLS